MQIPAGRIILNEDYMNPFTVIGETQTPEYFPIALNSLSVFCAFVLFAAVIWWLFQTQRLLGLAIFSFCVALAAGFVFVFSAMMVQNQVDRYLLTAAGTVIAAIYFYRRFYILE